jgi:hypothetical protein
VALFGKSDKPKTPPIDRRRSLEAIPVVDEKVAVKAEANGLLTLTVRIKRQNTIFARFLPPEMERNVKLDELGTFVFGLIDGKRTTKDLIEEFVKRYKVNRREAELSCVRFLRSLAERRVIAIAVR